MKKAKKKPVDRTSAAKQKQKGKLRMTENKNEQKIKKIEEMEQADDLSLELVEHVVSKLVERVKLLEGHVKKLDEMFATMIKMANPVAQRRFRSGDPLIRDGNIYQNAAFPGSPNAEKIEPATSPETADDPGGDLPSLE